jgi:hypothetical protein
VFSRKNAFIKHQQKMFQHLKVSTRAIQKVTSGELLTKQAMRETNIIYKNYVHTSATSAT